MKQDDLALGVTFRLTHAAKCGHLFNQNVLPLTSHFSFYSYYIITAELL